eukprot:1064096-Rhodomonas_salina.1
MSGTAAGRAACEQGCFVLRIRCRLGSGEDWRAVVVSASRLAGLGADACGAWGAGGDVEADCAAAEVPGAAVQSAAGLPGESGARQVPEATRRSQRAGSRRAQLPREEAHARSHGAGCSAGSVQPPARGLRRSASAGAGADAAHAAPGESPLSNATPALSGGPA